MEESPESIKADVDRLNGELGKMQEQYDEWMKNPKVYHRQLQVLGRKMTRMNYTIGNRLVCLDKAVDEIKH